MGEESRAVFLLSRFIGHQSRQSVVKNSKKTLQLFYVWGGSPKIWRNHVIVGEEFAEKINTPPVKNCEQIEWFPWSFPIFELNDSKWKHAKMWLVFKKTAFVWEIFFLQPTHMSTVCLSLPYLFQTPHILTHFLTWCFSLCLRYLNTWPKHLWKKIFNLQWHRLPICCWLGEKDGT